MKKILTWLFKDFAYYLYDLAEAKFTLHTTTFAITKSFSPSTIPVGGTSTLTITLDNSLGASAITIIPPLVDTLPPTITIASPNGVVNGTNGTVTATSGSGSVILTGATIPIATTQMLQVNVVGSMVGSFINTILQPLFPTPPTATLTVIAAVIKKKTRNRVGVTPLLCATDVEGNNLRFRGTDYVRIKEGDCYFIPKRYNG